MNLRQRSGTRPDAAPPACWFNHCGVRPLPGVRSGSDYVLRSGAVIAVDRNPEYPYRTQPSSFEFEADADRGLAD